MAITQVWHAVPKTNGTGSGTTTRIDFAPAGLQVGDMLVAACVQGNSQTGYGEYIQNSSGHRWTLFPGGYGSNGRPFWSKVVTAQDIGVTHSFLNNGTASDYGLVVWALRSTTGAPLETRAASGHYDGNTRSLAGRAESAAWWAATNWWSSYGAGNFAVSGWGSSHYFESRTVTGKGAAVETFSSRTATWWSSVYPLMVVDELNAPPSAPGAFTFPVAGSVVDKIHRITWGAATDPNGDPVTYRVWLSLDNTATWKELTAGGAVSQPFLDYNFSPEVETTQAYLDVRAYDNSGAVGNNNNPIRSSVFRIAHPVAPAAPIDLTATPTTVRIGDNVRIAWKHQDILDRFPDPQTRYQLRWRMVEGPPPAAPTLPVTAGLVAHLNPSAMTQADGTTITSAPAVGGSAAWTVQGAGPVLRSGGVNKQRYLQQTSAGTGLRWNVNLTGDNTVFVAARQRGTASFRILSGLNNNWLHGWHGGYEEVFYYEAWLRTHGEGIQMTQDLRVFAETRTGSTTHIYRGRDLLLTTTASPQGPNGLTTNGYLGQSEFSDSDVYEVIAYNRGLSQDEVLQVEAYLAEKYALR